MEFLGGIILGQAGQELLNAVLETKSKVHYFRDNLEQLQSTLENIMPRIKESDRLNAQIMDRPTSQIQKLKEELDKGKKLVRNCLNIPFWDALNRCRYSKQIVELNKTLGDFFNMEVMADTWLIVQQVLVDLREERKVILRPEVSCSAPVPDTTFGLDLPLMEVKKLLFREDVKVLGLCGPPGCGKTTLAAMLCRDRDVKDIFKNIFFLRVSSTPNLKEIVERLFKPMMNRTPTFLDDEDAVMQLGNLLESEPKTTLLVLDDVWHDSLVQNFVFRIEKYKILVTSRTECPTFDCTYSLKMLTESDSMELFCHSAFPPNGNGNYEEPDKDLLYKIVSGCKGLPLALTVIGHSLRRQPPRMWQTTERRLSSCSIFDSNNVLLNRLGTSLDLLEKQVQECFMDLSSFPEDQRIPASSLIDIWVELHGIDEVDAYFNLRELSTKNLVNLIEISGDAGEIDGNMNKLFVTQHDLLRDLAIYRSRQQGTRLIMERREDSLHKRKREEQEYNARLVSIHTGEKFMSNWFDMQLPEAEVLILDFFATKYTLPPFMEKMEKLKVLIIVNHGHYYTQLNCLTTPGYLSHLKRVRLEKILVPSLTEIAMPLKNLEKISLFMCEFGQALSCEIDFPYIFPNLVEIDIDYCNDIVELPQGICNLVHLQNLSITNCHELSELPESIGNMRDLTVLRLHACTKLSKLPDSLRELQKLRFLDISDCINVELPEWISELRSLRKLNMGGCSGPSELPYSASALVHLRSVICDEDTAILWNRLKRHLPQLHITVRKDSNNLLWLGDLKGHNLRF